MSNVNNVFGAVDDFYGNVDNASPGRGFMNTMNDRAIFEDLSDGMLNND